MESNPEISPSVSEQRFWIRLLKIASGYFAISILTLPTMDKLWLGISRGSYSPDITLTRPWALAVAYLVPLGILLGFFLGE